MRSGQHDRGLEGKRSNPGILTCTSQDEGVGDFQIQRTLKEEEKVPFPDMV